MARRDPYDGRGRLAAVLDPWPGGGAGAGPPHIGPPHIGPPHIGPPHVDAPDGETPTQPLPVVTAPGRRAGRLARLTDRWVPARWRGARLDPGRPGALALLLVAAVAAVLAAVGVWWEAPRAEPVAAGLPALVDTTAAAAPTGPSPAVAVPTGAPPTAGPAAPLVVAVAGRVARPGLVRVPAGARVADVLEAAGGPLPGTDLAGVNLARKVSDGEQVAVGVPGATDAVPPPGADGTGGGAGGGATGSAATGPLDLNAATLEQLDGLPGVGPVTAQRIVEWRTRNGRFASVDQLREVEGIGERRFGQLRELVRV
ncbi:MAG: competence protein ComEA [Pseudonocardiales bacterium]|nr:competence protein ComEA [Pseudonocardiales bacterium]